MGETPEEKKVRERHEGMRAEIYRALMNKAIHKEKLFDSVLGENLIGELKEWIVNHGDEYVALKGEDYVLN